MFCIHCGKQLADGAQFCTYCGATQKSAQPAVSPEIHQSQTPLDPIPGLDHSPVIPGYADSPVYAQPTKPQKPKKQKTGVLIAIILVAVLLVGGLGYYFYSQSVYESNQTAYVEAELLLKKQDYDGALEAFLALGNFEDAKERASELENLQEDYEDALELLNKGSYDKAQKAFGKLGDYRDSETYMKYRVTYQEALDHMENGDYRPAAELFDTVESYEDAADLASKCRLNLALDLLNRGDYEEALAYQELLKPADADILTAAYGEICADDAFLAYLESVFPEIMEDWNAFPDADALLSAITTLKTYQNRHFEDATLQKYVEEFLEAFQSMYDCITASYIQAVDYYWAQWEICFQIDQIWDSHGAFASTELYDKYVGKQYNCWKFYTIEGSLTEWFDELETSEYNETLGEHVSFYNDTGYLFDLEVVIYYFDENDNYIYTSNAKTYTFTQGKVTDIIIEPDRNLGNGWLWNMDWTIYIYE